MPRAEARTPIHFTESDMLACIPSLRAYARFLTGNGSRAEDLVQDAVVRTLAAAHQFQAGTNLKAWMSTILRHQYCNELRKNRARIQTVSDMGRHEAAVLPNQESSLDFGDFCRACWLLSEDQREALVLIGVGGLSYTEAAEVCNCPVGTIKSRLSRARLELLRILQDGSLIEKRRSAPALSYGAGNHLDLWRIMLPAGL